MGALAAFPKAFVLTAALALIGCSFGSDSSQPVVSASVATDAPVPANLSQQPIRLEHVDALIADAQQREAKYQEDVRMAAQDAAAAKAVIPVINEVAPPASHSSARVRSSVGAGASSSETETERMERQAETAFGPTLQGISRRADTLDANYRRYLDACYRKYTNGTANGRSTGTGSIHTDGAAIGRDWFVAWEANSTVEWQESWVATSRFKNESTAQCRSLWSDIDSDADLIKSELAGVETAAHFSGIYPGVIRELRARYRLVWQ